MADKPVTREEKYLAYLTGDYKGELPKPITRKEKYLYELCLKGIGGEISQEEIKNAVNEYLENNPVKPGATTEQAQQIEQNKIDIASLKTETGSLKTRLNDIVGYDHAAAHNAIYRGKYLGTQFTAEMSANIKNGTFKDLYCGDYLVINGTTYRFMDLDYLYKTGDTSLETHHILVVPDAPMYNHVMNDTNTTEGGYVGSKMYTSGLDQALAKVKADFGEAHIVTYRNLLVNATSNGVPSSWSWYSRQIDLMNEEMVYGTRAWSQATQNGYSTGTNKSQLAAFKHNHSLISSCRTWYWLRAVRSSTDFCGVYGHGTADNYGASFACGVRPCFLIS